MLNKHPGIVCSHGADQTQYSIVDDSARRAALKTVAPEKSQKRVDDGMHRIHSQPLDTLFEELRRIADARAYGNVHMHSVRSLLASAERFPLSVSIQAADLIRHPVSWVDSRAGNFAARMSRSSVSAAREAVESYKSQQGVLGPIVTEYCVDIEEYENLAFLTATAQLGGLVADVMAWPDLWYVKMENLTSDREFFAHFVHEITAGAVTADATFLDSVFSAGKRNSHSSNSNLGPEGRYAVWPVWKQRAFQVMSQKFHIPDIYGKLGYDLSAFA